MCSEPTDAPTDLRVSRVDNTTVTIHWKPVDLSSVQGEFKEYRVRLAVFLKWNWLQSWSKNSFWQSPYPPLHVLPIYPFLPLLPPSCTTGVSPVWSQVWWSIKRRGPKVSTAPWLSHSASSVTWCPTLNTRCSWLRPTTALRVRPATRWNSPPMREVRTLPSQLKYCMHAVITCSFTKKVLSQRKHIHQCHVGFWQTHILDADPRQHTQVSERIFWFQYWGSPLAAIFVEWSGMGSTWQCHRLTPCQSS